MVEHHIKLQDYAKLVQSLQVHRAYKLFIDVVVDDRKTAIQVAVEKGGKDIEKREDILEFRTFQLLHRVCQAAAHAVWVGIQHYSPG
jgi:hypothetical protein